MEEKTYAFITGASTGIGKFLAIECAKRKMNLVLVALPDETFEQNAFALGLHYGVEVLSFAGDLTDMRFIYSIHQQITERQIQLNMLVNNAGTGYEGKFEELPIEYCNSLMVLNMQAMVILSRLFINNLKNHPSSFILNVSSLASFTPMPYKCMYAASKSFVYSFTRALRSELKHTSVSVSVLCPGAVPTNELKRKNIQSHGIIAKLSSMNPEEIAEIAIAATLNKQQVIVPGICNKLSMYIMKVIPQSLQLQLLNFGYAKLNSSI